MAIQWKDNQGRAWSCRLTIGDAKRLKAAGYDIGDEQTFASMFSDPVNQIEIIAELLRPQWERLELTYEAFVDFACDTPEQFETVTASFVEGLTDFFIRTGRKWLADLISKTADASRKGAETQTALANSEKVERAISKSLEAAEAKANKSLDDLLAKVEAELSGE